MTRLFLCLLFLWLANIYNLQAQNQKKIDSLQTVFQKATHDSIRFHSSIAIGNEYSYSLLDSCLKYQLLSLSIAKKMKNEKLCAETYIYLIYTYGNFGKYATAFSLADSALAIYEKYQDYSSQAEIYCVLSGNYTAIGQIDRSYDCIFKAIELFAKDNNYLWQGRTMNLLGNAYAISSQYSKSLKYYHQALTIVKKHDDYDDISIAAGGIAYVYIKQKNYDSAEVYGKIALNTALQIESWHNVTGALGYIGLINSYKNNHKAAEDTINLAMQYIEKYKIFSIKVNVLGEATTIYLNSKKYQKAIEIATELIKLATSENDTEYQIEGYFALAQAYEELQNYKKALENHKKYYALADTIWHKERNEKIVSMEVKYETAQKEKDNILLKLVLAKQQKEQYVWVFSLSTLLFLALGLAYLLWLRTKHLKNKQLVAEQEKQLINKENVILVQQKNQQDIENKSLQYEIQAQQEINLLEQEKLQEKIDSKSRELASFAIAMSQKNAIFQNLKERISENWKSKASLDQKLKDILSDIDNSMDMETEWKDFKQHFEEVHPDFFTKLHTLCDTLTLHDIRFCAYIKMNMLPKDIAQMMNVTNRAIQMNRYRIKKKLKLDEEIDFADYIREL